MKIALVLQRNFAYIGHELAKLLKERHGVKEFCGFVAGRDGFAFLKNQTDIRYNALLLDEDIHAAFKNEAVDLAYLRRLEEEYGIPTLWQYLEMDRVVRHGQHVREYPYDKPSFSHEEMMRILQAKSKAILSFLEQEKPDVLILSVIADMSTMFLYQAAKKKGVKVLLLSSARFERRYTVTESPYRFTFVEKALEEEARGRLSLSGGERVAAEDFLQRFRKKPSTYSHEDTPERRPLSRRRQFAFLTPQRFAKSVRWFVTMSARFLRNPHKDDPYLVKPWHYLFDRAVRKIRTFIGFDGLYDEAVPGEPYAYFPLHMEPEMAISLYAPFYTDQLWLIRQVARAVPIYFKVYVKEHPAMFGFRPRSFYRALKKIPNVKLMRPAENGFDLISNTRLITTLSGTSGFEGILLKKPVITFSDVFYNTLPATKRCSDIHDLPRIIREQLANGAHNEEALVRFLAALFRESVDLKLIQMWNVEGASKLEKHHSDLVALVDFIADKLLLECVPEVRRNSAET